MPNAVPQEENPIALRQEVTELKSKVGDLELQVAWFKKQMFGAKSERRLVEMNPDQLGLDGFLGDVDKPEVIAEEATPSQRGKAKKQRADGCVTDSGLRFDEDVPVEVIKLESPELNGPDADQYEVIGTKSLHRLAQRPASLVVLRYDQPVVKRKGSNDIVTSSAPVGVFDQSLADVSFLAGMLAQCVRLIVASLDSPN